MITFEYAAAGISPQEEWHGPYEVVQGENARWYVIDNQGRAGIISARGWPDEDAAARSRDHIDQTRARAERARGVADRILGVVCDLAEASSWEDLCERASTERALALSEQFEGAPGRVVVPEDGEAYYEFSVGSWSGRYSWPSTDICSPEGDPVDLVNYSDCSRGPFAGVPEAHEQPSAARLQDDLAAWVRDHAHECR